MEKFFIFDDICRNIQHYYKCQVKHVNSLSFLESIQNLIVKKRHAKKWDLLKDQVVDHIKIVLSNGVMSWVVNF